VAGAAAPLLISVFFCLSAACAIAALRASEYAGLLFSGGGVVLAEGVTSVGLSADFFLSSGGKAMLRPLFIAMRG